MVPPPSATGVGALPRGHPPIVSLPVCLFFCFASQLPYVQQLHEHLATCLTCYLDKCDLYLAAAVWAWIAPFKKSSG